MSARNLARPAAPAGNKGLVRRALLGTLALAGLAGGAWVAYDTASGQPIRDVRFAGDVARVARADLERLAESLRGLPAEDASLVAVRDAARRIPWVREATVRRHYPDTVEIAIEAHAPLARWNETSLVSPAGEVFVAEHDGQLPKFSGPDGTAAEMVREHAALARALEPLGVPLAELKLSARGAWQAILATGLVLELGRTDTAGRIARFAAAWPRMAELDPPPRYADLRYPNGFAVRRAPLVEPKKSPTRKNP